MALPPRRTDHNAFCIIERLAIEAQPSSANRQTVGGSLALCTHHILISIARLTTRYLPPGHVFVIVVRPPRSCEWV